MRTESWGTGCTMIAVGEASRRTTTLSFSVTEAQRGEKNPRSFLCVSVPPCLCGSLSFPFDSAALGKPQCAIGVAEHCTHTALPPHSAHSYLRPESPAYDPHRLSIGPCPVAAIAIRSRPSLPHRLKCKTLRTSHVRFAANRLSCSSIPRSNPNDL